MAKLKSEFDKRNVKVIALSVDPVSSHKGWIGDIEETQSAKLNFPILADADRKVAKLYDMIHPEANDTQTVRSVFVIDPKKKIRLVFTYPASTGRNFDEILRVIDSLQLTDRYSVATPVDWKDGGDCVIVPSLKDPGGSEAEVPEGLERGQAVPAHDPAAEQVEPPAEPPGSCSGPTARGRCTRRRRHAGFFVSAGRTARDLRRTASENADEGRPWCVLQMKDGRNGRTGDGKP